MDGWKRRLFHLCTISLLLIVALLAPEKIFLGCLGAAAILAIGVELSRLLISPSLNQWLTSQVKVLKRESEASRPWASTYVILSALLVFGVFWLFEKEKDIAVMAVAFLAVGDPVAGIVGGSLGRRRVWGKSLEGTLACFLSCLAIGALLGNTVLSVGLLVIFAGSLCAALVELLPLRLNDNLTIPIAAAGIMVATGCLIE